MANDTGVVGHNGNAPQTLAWEPLDSLHILACQRIGVPSVIDLLKPKWLQQLRDNAPNACCHEPGNLDIDAWYSMPSEQAKGKPDIYKFYCNVCSACHVKFCVGGDHPEAVKYTPQQRPELFDQRPFWEVR